jgi:hypothetical protein
MSPHQLFYLKQVQSKAHLSTARLFTAVIRASADIAGAAPGKPTAFVHPSVNAPFNRNPRPMPIQRRICFFIDVFILFRALWLPHAFDIAFMA